MAILFKSSGGKLFNQSQFQYQPGQAKFQYENDNNGISLLSPTNTTTPSGGASFSASGVVRGLQPQGGLAFTQGSTEQTNKILAGAKSFAGAIVRQGNKVVTGVKSFVGGLTTSSASNFSQSVSGALSFVGALLKQVSHPLAGTHSFAGSLVRRANKILSGVLSFASGTLIKSVQVLKTGVLSFASGTLVRQVNKVLAGVLSFASGTLVRQVNKVLSGVLSFASGTLVRVVSILKTGTLSFASGTLVRQTNKIVAGVLSFAGVIASTKVFQSALTAALSFSGALVRQTRVLKTGSLSFVGPLVRQVNKVLAGVLSFVGALATLKIVLKSLSAALSFSGSLVGRANKVLVGAITPAATLVRQINKVLSGVLSDSGALLKSLSRSLTGSLSFVGNFVKTLNRSLVGVLSFSGSLVRRANKVLSGVLSFSGAMTTHSTLSKLLTATLTSAGSLVRRANKVLSGISSTSGALLKRLNRSLSAVLSFIGDFSAFNTSGPQLFTQSLSGLLTLNATGLLKGILLQAALSLGGVFNGVKSKLLTGAISFSGVVIRPFIKTITAVLSLSGPLVKRISTAKSGVLNLFNTGALRGFNLQGGISFFSSVSSFRPVSTKFLALAGVASYVGNIVKTTIFHRIGSITSSSVIEKIKFVSKQLTAILTINAYPVKRLFKIVPMTNLSFSSLLGGVSHVVEVFLTGTLTIASGVVSKLKLFSYVVNGGLNFINNVGLISKHVLKNTRGQLNLNAIGLIRGIAIQAAISFGGFIYGVIPNFFKSITGGLSFSGGFTKIRNKLVGGILGLVSVGRSVSRFNSGVLDLVGTLTRLKVIPVNFTGSISFSGAFSKLRVKLLIATMSLSGAISKFPRKVFNSILSFVGTPIVGNARFISLIASISYVGNFVTSRGLANLISLGGVLSSSGLIGRRWTKFVTGTLLATSTLIKRVGALKFSSLSFDQVIGITGLGLAKFLNGSLNTVGSVTKRSTRILSSVLSFSAVLGNLSALKVKAIVGAITPAATLSTLKAKIISLTGSIVTMTGVVRKRVNLSVSKLTGVLTLNAIGALKGYNLQGGLAFTNVSIAARAKVLVGTLTSSSILALRKQLGKILTGVLFLGNATTSFGRVLSSKITFVGVVVPIKVRLFSLTSTLSFASGILSRRTGKVLGSSIAYIGTIIKQTRKGVFGNVSFALGDLIRPGANLYSLAVDGLVNFSGSVVRRTNKVLSAVISITGGIQKLVRLFKVSALSFVGTVTEKSVKLLSLSSSLSVSGSIIKRLNRSLIASLSSVGSTFRRIPKVLSGVITITGSAAALKTILKSVSGVLVLNGITVVRKVTLFVVNASIGFSSSIKKSIGFGRDRILTLSSAFEVKKNAVLVNITASIGLAGAFIKRVNKSPSAILALTGSTVKSIRRSLVAILDITTEFIAQKASILKSITGTLSFSGVTTKRVDKLLFALQYFSGLVQRRVSKFITSTLPLSGRVGKSISSFITSVLSFVGLDVPLYVPLPKSSTALFAFFKYKNATLTGLRTGAPTINNIRYTTSTIVNLKWS